MAQHKPNTKGWAYIPAQRALVGSCGLSRALVGNLWRNCWRKCLTIFLTKNLTKFLTKMFDVFFDENVWRNIWRKSLTKFLTKKSLTKCLTKMLTKLLTKCFDEKSFDIIIDEIDFLVCFVMLFGFFVLSKFCRFFLSNFLSNLLERFSPTVWLRVNSVPHCNAVP